MEFICRYRIRILQTFLHQKRHSRPIGSKPGRECSTRAVVTAVSTHPSQKTTVVYAEEEGSGLSLRCDVIVAKIVFIDIVTTTRILYLGDSPEEFEVRALDDKGNTFSSLEGLEFEWALLSDDTAPTVIDAKSILKFVTFQDSKYSALSHIAKFEAKDKQGDRILIEGLRAGSAKVETRLKAEVFQDVKPSVVRLIVIDHLMLNPSQDIYILVYCQVQFYVEKLRQGKVTVLPMPSSQYHLDVGNGTVATLDASTSMLTGLALGDTHVTLKDHNIREGFSLPSTGVHVIEPKYLGFVILPGKNWVLQTNSWYEILIEVYDRDSNKMFPANIPNIRIKTIFPELYFEVKRSTENGSFHYIRTKQSGITEIEASLLAIVKPDGEKVLFDNPISESQEVEIYDAVKVMPEYLSFPWLPTGNRQYSYRLEATGGTGTYIWSSSDLPVANVNVQGTVTTTKEMGVTEVTAADSRNPSHYATCMVYVQAPTEMQFIDGQVEVLVGDELHLPLAMFGEVLENGKKIRISMTDCNMVALRSSIAARISLNQSTPGRMSSSPQALDPDSVAIVTPGSSKTVVFQGGPQPWVLDPTQYFERLNGEKAEHVSINHLKSSRGSRGLHVFQVLCTKRGEQVLTAEVGNGPTSRNKYPAIAKAFVQFRCANPIPVMNNNEIEFEVKAVDGQGNFFDNSSSLIIKWSSTNNNLASFDSSIMTYADLDGDVIGSRTLKAIQVCKLSTKEGPVTLTATSTSYDTGLLQQHGVKMSSKVEMLSTSVDLMLVSEARIEPTKLSIFNHPSNKAELKLLGGSSHFLLRPNPPGLADVTFIEKKKTIKVVPLHDGKLTITAIDLCLATTHHASAEVNMARCSHDTAARCRSVHAIAQEASVVLVRIILSIACLQVQVEHDIIAEVRVLDSTGQPLSVSFFPLMNLKPNVESDIIEVRPDQTKPPDQYTSYYTVHGAVLGFTNLAFTATSKTGQLVSSRVRDIQVFPPLRLSPRNVTLIVGQSFQIRSLGGPQPLSEVEYSNSEKQIAEISGSGIIEAQAVGNTVITGTAIGFDPDVGSDVTYSTDIVNVHVIELGGVKIHAPLHRLETDTLMPAYAMGLHDQETPFTIGSATPGLQFFWSSSNNDVIRVESVFSEDGVEPSPENSVSIRVRTVNPGEATLRLQVTVSSQSRHQVVRNGLLTDEIRIEVFEKLVMFDSCECRLLMAPRLKPDGSAIMSYTLLSNSGSEPIVTVSPQGVVTSGSRTGKAVIEVVARESFRANQTMLALVQVKPVSYIAIEPATHLATSQTADLKVYPVGLPLAFSVGFYDNIGERFDATNMRVAHRLHRFDYLQLQAGPENSTFAARAAHHGSTIFKIWDEDNPRVDDYVNVPVGNVLQPTDRDFVVGDVIRMPHASDWSRRNIIGLSIISSDNLNYIDLLEVRYRFLNNATFQRPKLLQL
ncbi:putative nuclear pore membrane glycoprotein [Apostichopus japonicus]|uniref:Putative nuclear pore membrane glycoprotein n=1 Tax=Stichopus japonicus TaxID=307972 RepID=A0A2G8L1V7_STIJA|nr:putative nuclear pore membrane glycoprotein [Apostichopus japonicus]